MSLTNPIPIWWKIYSFLNTNRRNSDVTRKFLYLDEIDQVKSDLDTIGEFEKEQVMLLNIKSYLAYGTFVLESDSRQAIIDQQLIKLLFNFLDFVRFNVSDKKKKGQARQAMRFIKHVPTKELNSIFWILTQCKALTSYIDFKWRQVRKSDGTDPYYIPVNVEIFRSKDALQLCLLRIKKFVMDRDNFDRRTSLDFLPLPPSRTSSTPMPTLEDIFGEEEGEEEEERLRGSPDSFGMFSTTFFNFFF
jgi:hypothetical protein